MWEDLIFPSRKTMMLHVSEGNPHGWSRARWVMCEESLEWDCKWESVRVHGSWKKSELYSRHLKKSLEALSQDWYNLDASWRVMLNLKLGRKQKLTIPYWLMCVHWEKMKKEKEIEYAPLKNKILLSQWMKICQICVIWEICLLAEQCIP